MLNNSLAVVPADVPDCDLLLGEAGLEVEGVGPVEARHRLLLGLGLTVKEYTRFDLYKGQLIRDTFGL